MKKSIAIAVCLLAAAGNCWFTEAGELEPPGPPASTMVTLQQIYDRLDEATGGGVTGLPKTGQSTCWDEDGNAIGCSNTGQDGEYQTGVSVDPRFTDNLDGTVTDNLTGLIWLRHADCFADREWTAAISDATTLADGSCGLTDGSVPGDWRLPNIRELHSLIDYGRNDPALPPGHPFVDVQWYYYWSSSNRADNSRTAWMVFLGSGLLREYFKSHPCHVWPVRAGQ